MKAVLRDKHGENGTTRLYYLQFAHSVETLIGRFCRQRKNKNHKKRTTCKHPEADQTRVQITSPAGWWGRGYSQCAGLGRRGSNNGTNLKQNGTKSHDGRRFPLLCSRWQAPRGGEPTHQDRQHHGFQIFTLFFFFSCVSIFFQVLSGSASFASPL